MARASGADLHLTGLDEDRALGEIEWPAFVDVGGALLGLALAVTAVAAGLFLRDGRAGIDPVGVALVAGSGVPWVLWLVRALGRATRRGGCHAHLALVPLGAVTVAGALGWADLGADAAYHFVAFQVVLVVAIEVASEPRRTATLVSLAGYVTILVGFAAAARHGAEVDWTGLVVWQVALLFTVGAGVAARQGLLAMHRSREVLAQQAIVTERRRVARDIHDVVAHTLSVTMLHVTAARMAVARGALEGAADALAEAERHGRASLADVRRTVRLLRADDPGAPVDAPQPDLARVTELVDGYRAAGLPVELSVAGPTGRVPPGAALAVYRALQEALANAARHGAGPARVELRVTDGTGDRDGGAVTLSVDNPVAHLDADAPRPGSGLLGMRERIAAAGGTLTAGRDDGRWSLRARIPLGRPPTATV